MAVARRQGGFTLIEVLIVVVIMAVLAATIIPQFSSSTQDAKESTLKYNLHALRSQIELYKHQHAGGLPALTGDSLPQLTSATNAAGATGVAGTSYPFGPYLLGALPANPVTGFNIVTTTSVFPPSSESGKGGWLYHESSGQIAVDSAAYLTW